MLLYYRVFGYLYLHVRLYGAITHNNVMQSSPFENFKPHIVTFSNAEVGRKGTIWKYFPELGFPLLSLRCASCNSCMSYFLHYSDNCFSQVPLCNNGCSKHTFVKRKFSVFIKDGYCLTYSCKVTRVSVIAYGGRCT